MKTSTYFWLTAILLAFIIGNKTAPEKKHTVWLNDHIVYTSLSVPPKADSLLMENLLEELSDEECVHFVVGNATGKTIAIRTAYGQEPIGPGQARTLRMEGSPMVLVEDLEEEEGTGPNLATFKF